MYKDSYCLVTVKDEGTNGIDGNLRGFLKEKHSKLDELAYRGSYIGIWKNIVPIFEKKDDNSSVSAYFAKGQFIGEEKIPTEVSLFSAGVFVGDLSKNIVSGVETSKNLRGLNITVIDSIGNVLLSKNIDSFISTRSSLF